MKKLNCASFSSPKMTEDFLQDIYNKISAGVALLKAKQMSQILPPKDVRVSWYCHLKGNISPKVLLCPVAAIGLLYGKTMLNITKADVVLSSLKLEQLRISAKSLMELSSWFSGGWWMRISIQVSHPEGFS